MLRPSTTNQDLQLVSMMSLPLEDSPKSDFVGNKAPLENPALLLYKAVPAAQAAEAAVWTAQVAASTGRPQYA